jgi:PncC family amidohydrolase
MDEPADTRLEVVVGRLLLTRNLWLSLAESCTGGLVSHRITNVPGSSGYYRGGVVAYSDLVKKSPVGVRESTLRQYGAVSEQAAREMAEGVRRVLETDVGLAVTGIAGPTGGTADKPVGLVFTAIATRDGTWAERNLWSGNRTQNKSLSAEAALHLLWRYLEGRLE